MKALAAHLAKHIRRYRHGILFSDASFRLPSKISFEGSIYQRFLDFIYIPDDTESLTPEQIVAVNDLRRELFHRQPIRAVNEAVRSLFIDIINLTKPRSVLELGPGHNPLFRFPPPGLNYIVADIDESAVLSNRALGLTSLEFTSGGELDLESNSVDLIIAVFVLQFRFTFTQIQTLSRILQTGGALLANLYRRSPSSRQHLADDFFSAGFLIARFRDPRMLCRDHEFWCTYKDARSPLVSQLASALSNTYET